jgi:hypothetical protein
LLALWGLRERRKYFESIAAIGDASQDLSQCSRHRTVFPRSSAMKSAPFEPGREWRTVNFIHRKELPMAQKSLLIAIAKHESRRNHFCHASIRTLAADAGCDQKTVRSALHSLAQGKIIRIRTVKGSSSKVVIDWKRFEKLPSATPPKSGRGVSHRRPLPKAGEVLLPNLAGDTPPKSGTPQGVKNQGGGLGAVLSKFEIISGERGSHHHRVDDFKKIVLAKCKDPDSSIETAIEIIIDRARQSGVNISSPKYLLAALDRFDFQAGQDREALMQRRRRRDNR